MWRTYETNEVGKRSMFMPMEKLKMAHATISSVINIEKMIKSMMVLQYFPLHDDFILKGIRKALLIRPLILTGILVEEEQSAGEKKLFNFFKTLAETADPADFDTNGSNLEQELAFKITRPMNLSIESVKNYFGEKLAMYFLFLTSYTHSIA